MIKIIAHRGASELAAQNTLSAFKKANEIGADGVETDVHMTRDGELVLCHNYYIDETSDGKGKISDMTLEELRKYDFGKYFSDEFEGEKIPTLEEMLKCTVKMKDVFIEIKMPEEERGLVNKTVECIKKHGMENLVTVSSFSLDIIKKVKDIDVNIKTALIVDMRSPHLASVLENPEQFCEDNCINQLHMMVLLINKDFVLRCAKHGIPIACWTVNDVRAKHLLEEMGVEFIITDKPGIFVGKQGKQAD